MTLGKVESLYKETYLEKTEKENQFNSLKAKLEEYLTSNVK
jgi:hypothetical protein